MNATRSGVVFPQCKTDTLTDVSNMDLKNQITSDSLGTIVDMMLES